MWKFLALALLVSAGCTGSSGSSSGSSGATAGSSGSLATSGAGGSSGSGSGTTGAASTGSTSGASSSGSTGAAGTLMLQPLLFQPTLAVGSYDAPAPDGGTSPSGVQIAADNGFATCSALQSATALPDAGLTGISIFITDHTGADIVPGTYPLSLADGGTPDVTVWVFYEIENADGSAQLKWEGGPGGPGSLTLTHVGTDGFAGSFEATMFDHTTANVVDAGPLRGTFDVPYCQSASSPL